jgi:hypothetical protein
VVRQINLARIAGSAAYIFSGACTSSEIVFDESIQREVCTYTFQVQKMIKGPGEKQFVIRLSKMLVDLKQVPTYNVGDEAILFLYEESRLGFTSTVGLGQGKFMVSYSPDGEKFVVNENNNRQLFKGMGPDNVLSQFSEPTFANKVRSTFKQQSGPIRHDVFLAIIEALVRQM